VSLQRRGNSFVGLCPFHQEKTPSFHVVPHKHLFHCFGCGAGGDAFKFLMEIEGVSFIEAVRELAQSAGVDLPERELSPDERRRLRQRASLYDVLDSACELYHHVLMTRPEGDPGRQYLKKRGITPETATRWRLGYAPGGWTTTLDQHQRQGYSIDLLHAAGLAKRKERNDGSFRHYDTFRDRVTIPITDNRGRVLAFGARLLEGDGPKYLNSPESALYHKSSVLFGLEHARQAIQRRDRAMLVEGYFDVISMHEAGFEEVVATCGTALTDDHLETLRRLTDNVVALFDADEAGGRAAERSLPLFFRAGVLPWRLEVPGAKDPDELVREEGPQAMEAALQRVEPLLEWVVERRLARTGGGSAARAAQLEELVELLSYTDGTEIVASVARRLKVHVDVLLEQVNRARRDRRRGASRPRDPGQIVPSGPPPGPPSGPVGGPPGGPDLDGPPPPEPPADFDDSDLPPVEGPPPPQARPWSPTRDLVHVLWLLVHRHEQVAELARVVGPAAWAHEGPVVPLLDALVQGRAASALLDEVEDPGVRRTLMAVVARDSLYTEDQAARGMAQALHRLLLPQLEQQVEALDAQARSAARARDWDRQGQATAASLALRKEIKAMKSALDGGKLSRYAEEAAAGIGLLSSGEIV